MRNITIIARNTSLELVRNRVLYTVLLFALAIILGAESVSHFEATTQTKLVTDISFTAITYFMVFLALFFSMAQVANEVEQRTIYFILTRPVRRFEFLLGKFLGVAAVLAVSLSIMAVTHFAALGREGAQGALLAGHLMILCQSIMVAAAVICLSTMASSILAVTITVFIYFFGSVSSTLVHGLMESGSKGLGGLVHALQLVLPNFNLFDLHQVVLEGSEVTLQYGAVLVLYAGLYAINFLIIGNFVFGRRDL